MQGYGQSLFCLLASSRKYGGDYAFACTIRLVWASAPCNRRGIYHWFSRQLDRFWKPFPQRPNERHCVRARVRNPCLFRLRQRIDVSDDNAEYNCPWSDAKVGQPSRNAGSLLRCFAGQILSFQLECAGSSDLWNVTTICTTMISGVGQNAKGRLRADLFRFASASRH